MLECNLSLIHYKYCTQLLSVLNILHVYLCWNEHRMFIRFTWWMLMVGCIHYLLFVGKIWHWCEVQLCTPIPIQTMHFLTPYWDYPWFWVTLPNDLKLTHIHMHVNLHVYLINLYHLTSRHTIIEYGIL